MNDTSMNVLYLIGNGFDLAQGARTSYPNFYGTYINSEPVNEVEREIINDINADLTNWSDMEWALGEFSRKVSDAGAFARAYESLTNKLKAYLIEEEAKVVLKEGSYKIFLTSPIEYLPLREQELLANSLQSLSGIIRIGAISFNYTDLFEKRIDYKYAKEDLSTPFLGKPAQFVSFIKIHGSLQNSILLGVDREEQIANEALANNPDVCDFLIKPRTNTIIGSLRDREARQWIDGADLIVVFGMSIGDTDKSWWQRIYKRLESFDYARMLIFYYAEDVTMSNPWKAGKRRREIVSRFERVADIPAEKMEMIEKKIFVCFNKGFFNPNTPIEPVISK